MFKKSQGIIHDRGADMRQLKLPLVSALNIVRRTWLHHHILL